MRLWVFIIAGVLSMPVSALAARNPSTGIEDSTRDADKAAATQASSDADKWAGTQKEDPPPAKKVEPPAPAQATTPAAAPTPPAPPAAAAATPPAATPPAAAPAASNLPGMQAAAPAATSAPAPAKTYTPRAGLNEMKGKMQSKSDDPRAFRLLVQGGFNVEFTYDSQTTLVNGGSPITMDDLDYGDEIIVRYLGKELKAIEIDRVSKAPRPQ